MEALLRERRDRFNPAIVWLRWRMRSDSGPNSSSHFPKIKNDVSITTPTASYPEQWELMPGAQVNPNRYEVFIVLSVKEVAEQKTTKPEEVIPSSFIRIKSSIWLQSSSNKFFFFFYLSYFMLILQTPFNASNGVCSPKRSWREYMCEQILASFLFFPNGIKWR